MWTPLLIVALAYAVMSVVTLGAMALDKRAAERGARRIPEKSLHTLELLGGWPGSLVAMRLIRHKNRKPAYFVVTIVIVLLHVAGWALLLMRPWSGG
jgi:uncharacterized membrane protein YsdA (DUF1294 family)